MEAETFGPAPPFRVLEFYSGIGGMRFSLEVANVPATVVEAFEINELANDVYEHNFCHRPNQGNIQRLTAEVLEKYKANVWLLSPPCQPYTRQGLRKDSGDARASSFLHLLDLLPRLLTPPSHIFVENVVGFEFSSTHRQLIEVLQKEGFVTQEFILTPLQFGIPYSRPRYFFLAKKWPLGFCETGLDGLLLCKPVYLNCLLRKGLSYSSFNDEHLFEIIHSLDLSMEPEHRDDIGYTKGKRLLTTVCNETIDSLEPELSTRTVCMPIRHYLELKNSQSMDTRNFQDENELSSIDCFGESKDVNQSHHSDADGQCRAFMTDMFTAYSVPKQLVERCGDVFDIVTPDSKRCCCFTKSYGRYAKGTGSFLATKNLEKIDHLCLILDKNHSQHDCKNLSLNDLGLRYFTPREIANLHAFPPVFTFPKHVSLKQRYALLGNSLSISVVSTLLWYLLA